MELSQQFNGIAIAPKRPIRMSPAVRNARGRGGGQEKTQQQKWDSQAERGLITPEEHHVLSTGQLDHPLHPKSGTVVKGSVIKGEIEA